MCSKNTAGILRYLWISFIMFGTKNKTEFLLLFPATFNAFPIYIRPLDLDKDNIRTQHIIYHSTVYNGTL